MKLYRATLPEPIVFKGSEIITAESLDSIDFDRVIYCEVSSIGAMGNAGGILMFVLDDEDRLITYETNIAIDEQSYDAVLEHIKQNGDVFMNYSGGMGNDVFINRGVQLEIDEKYQCFWYHAKNTKLRIDSSVQGVFLSVIAGMNS